MGRGKRHTGKAAAGTRSGVATLGVPVSKQELKVRRLMQVWDKSEGNDPIYTFSFHGFAPVFAFDRRDGTLSVVDDFGLGKVIEKIDLGQDEAEWLDDQEILDYAAIYAIRRGQFYCRATSSGHPVAFDDNLRVEVGGRSGEFSLSFWMSVGSREAETSAQEYFLLATHSFDFLEHIVSGLMLSGDWIVRPDELTQLLELAYQVAPFVGLPLPPFSRRFRKWDKSVPEGRTRSSLLAK